MYRRLTLLLLTLLISYSAYANVGFRQLQINENSNRPLDIALWYPTTDAGKIERIGENAVFHGTPALRNAKPTARQHPLLLLSHGYGGNWRNLKLAGSGNGLSGLYCGGS